MSYAELISVVLLSGKFGPTPVCYGRQYVSNTGCGFQTAPLNNRRCQDDKTHTQAGKNLVPSRSSQTARILSA